MRAAELFQAQPTLEALLERQPELRPVVERLLAHSLHGALSRYLQDAPESALRRFLEQAAGLDLERIEQHRRALAEQAPVALGVEDVDPARLVTLEEQAPRRPADEAAGLESLRQGRWASVAFAGGAGTRFFSRLDELDRALAEPNEVLRQERFDPAEPKGVFPISPVRGLRFYDQILAEALAAGARCGRLPWVLFLTSTETHERTVAYLEQADLWGFPPRGWLAFPQAEEPRLDEEGHLVVIDETGRLALTGDGHGGVYRALLAPGPDGPSVLDRLRADGVDQLVMHNVDNAAARPFALARLGFHLREGAQFTLSATRKTDPEEKVGVLMRLRASGKMEVIEYNVIDPELAAQRDPRSGRLIHEAGNINTNLVAAAALRPDIAPTLYTGKVIDSLKGPVETSSLEMLNQHLTRLLDPERVRAYEVERTEFFMPTKNVTGADSVESTVQMMSERFAGLLRAAGARVAPGALCDLHPAVGDTPAELARLGIGPGWRLLAGSRLYLCARLPAAGDGPPFGSDLVLEPKASLVIDCRRPWGEVGLGPGRRLELDPAGASRLSVGRGVTVRAGVRVAVRLLAGARLTIAAGREFCEDTAIELGRGDALAL